MPRKLIENIGPQEGKQEAFLASTADIVIYGGCVSRDTQYLSRSGWKNICDYDGKEEVAQWKNGLLEFVLPTKYHHYAAKEMISFSNENRISMILSEQHRLPLYDRSGKFVVKSAIDIEKHPSRYRIPVNFKVNNNDLSYSDTMLRLIVAIHADGSLTFRTERPGAYCRISLRKQRKIDRLLSFFKKLNISYHEYRNPRRPTEVRYGFQSPVLTKHFVDEYWSASERQLRIILDEMSYWDGAYSGVNGGDICYNTTSKNDADFIQYVAHACGRIASISTVPKSVPEHKTVYRVHVTKEGSVKSKTTIRKDNVVIKRIKANKMYCFTVPSSFWLARHNGKIFVTGNSAGSGKSFSLLLMPLYYTEVKGFDGIIFRRTFSEITTPGGLWDKAQELYTKMGAKCRGKPEYTAYWPSGSKVVFRHLEYESDIYSHQGGQYCFIGYDELTLFTRLQFFYLISRNRSDCGVKPFMRATCNPDSESWVKDFIKWWLDEDTGFPIEERSGIIKYFTIEDNEILWVDKDWLHPKLNIGPKSITFIPALMDDNPILVKKNPEYKASLLAQSKVDRDRLLLGNWNARYEDGMFQPDWFMVKDALPVPTSRKIRVWDRANTEKDENNRNPDYTAGALGYLSGDILCIEDVQHFRASPAKNEDIIHATAESDGRDIEIVLEREPASSGKDVLFHYKERVLKDFVVRDFKPSGNRTDIAKPLAALAERRKVWIRNGVWNKDFIKEFSVFPPSSGAGHDDIVCAIAQLYTELTKENRVIAGYSSKNLTDRKVYPEGIDYATFYQEKDLRLYGCFFHWDYKDRVLYCHDEIVLQSFTISQIKQVIMTKCAGIPVVYCNDFMNKEGDSISRLLARDNVHLTESPRFNDEGAISMVSQMFATMNIFVSVSCVETDRQLRSWMIEGGKPQDMRIGCAKCICMVISDLREKKRIEPPPAPKPYSREKIADSTPQIAATVGKTNIPMAGYSRRTRHWMY